MFISLYRIQHQHQHIFQCRHTNTNRRYSQQQLKSSYGYCTNIYFSLIFLNAAVEVYAVVSSLRFPDLGFLDELGKLFGLYVTEMNSGPFHAQGFSSSIGSNGSVKIADGFTSGSQVELIKCIQCMRSFCQSVSLSFVD